MNTQLQQRRFKDDAIETASPAKLVTMLYDRLVRDLVSAEQSASLRDFSDTGKHLIHAQDIVSELRSSLDLTAWDGAPALASIYGFLLGELIRANVKKEPAKIAACRDIVQPLRDAWHTAAAGLAPTTMRSSAFTA